MGKLIPSELNHAFAQICAVKCKDYLTKTGQCIKICPEMLYLIETLTKHTLIEYDTLEPTKIGETADE